MIETDAQSDSRIEVLGFEVAAREAAVDIRDHHAAVQVDSLERLIIDQKGYGGLGVGAFVAA